MDCPCKGCDMRMITCHVFCQEYRAWRDEIDAKNAERQAQKEAGLYVSRNAVKQMIRNLKRRK